MSRLPEHVRAAVIQRVYADADRVGWDALPAPAKSTQYDRWTADPHIGGILSGYLEAERIRTWLKDNPLKHYTNAKHGVGTYARYANVTRPTPSRVASAALGRDWQVDETSVRDKPLRFRAVHGDEHAAVAYGPARKFRDLLWAALNDAVDPHSPARTLVAIVEHSLDPTSDSERTRQQQLADRCRIEVRWISMSTTTGAR